MKRKEIIKKITADIKLVGSPEVKLVIDSFIKHINVELQKGNAAFIDDDELLIIRQTKVRESVLEVFKRKFISKVTFADSLAQSNTKLCLACRNKLVSRVEVDKARRYPSIPQSIYISQINNLNSTDFINDLNNDIWNNLINSPNK